MWYFVSGHKDSSTLDDWVNRLPIKPPPDTSQVTKQSRDSCEMFQAIVVDTKELSRSIDVTRNAREDSMGLFIVVDAEQSSQHYNRKQWRIYHSTSSSRTYTLVSMTFL